LYLGAAYRLLAEVATPIFTLGGSSRVFPEMP